MIPLIFSRSSVPFSAEWHLDSKIWPCVLVFKMCQFESTSSQVLVFYSFCLQNIYSITLTHLVIYVALSLGSSYCFSICSFFFFFKLLLFLLFSFFQITAFQYYDLVSLLAYWSITFSFIYYLFVFFLGITMYILKLLVYLE